MNLTRDYYLVKVDTPSRPELPAYTAECEDLITSLGLTWHEANIFKSLWRTGIQRQFPELTKEGNTEEYSAHKIKYFADRNLFALEQEMECEEHFTHEEVLDLLNLDGSCLCGSEPNERTKEALSQQPTGRTFNSVEEFMESLLPQQQYQQQAIEDIEVVIVENDETGYDNLTEALKALPALERSELASKLQLLQNRDKTLHDLVIKEVFSTEKLKERLSRNISIEEAITNIMSTYLAKKVVKDIPEIPKPQPAKERSFEDDLPKHLQNFIRTLREAGATVVIDKSNK